MIERFVTLRPTRAVSSARMSIDQALRSLRQRLASSATLQPVRRVAWIWLGAALLLVFGALFGAVRASAGKPSARAWTTTASARAKSPFANLSR